MTTVGTDSLDVEDSSTVSPSATTNGHGGGQAHRTVSVYTGGSPLGGSGEGLGATTAAASTPKEGPTTAADGIIGSRDASVSAGAGDASGGRETRGAVPMGPQQQHQNPQQQRQTQHHALGLRLPLPPGMARGTRDLGGPSIPMPPMPALAGNAIYAPNAGSGL